ncbi:hypothetical protein D3C78_1769270 [compost metagenome]
MHQPQAGGGQRVTQGNGTTMNVELFHIELQRPGHGQHLGSLRLVDFETVDLFQVQAAAFQQQRDGRGRPDAHGVRRYANSRGHQQPRQRQPGTG